MFFNEFCQEYTKQVSKKIFNKLILYSVEMFSIALDKEKIFVGFFFKPESQSAR